MAQIPRDKKILSIIPLPARKNVDSDNQLPDPPQLGKTTPPPRHKGMHKPKRMTTRSNAPPPILKNWHKILTLNKDHHHLIDWTSLK